MYRGETKAPAHEIGWRQDEEEKCRKKGRRKDGGKDRENRGGLAQDDGVPGLVSEDPPEGGRAALGRVRTPT